MQNAHDFLDNFTYLERLMFPPVIAKASHYKIRRYILYTCVGCVSNSFMANQFVSLSLIHCSPLTTEKT